MNTRRYGLIGKSLEHSFSVDYFADKFRKEGIQDAVYEAFPLEKIEGFPELLEEYPDLAGLNVTIPYKETIIPYLDELSDTARTVGAVNTVRLSEGKKEGFNTDLEGFEKDITPRLNQSSKKALILGTGGASKAVAHVLEKLDYELLFISRREEGERIRSYEELTAELVGEQELIVNTTPVGTWPNTNECPPIPYHGIQADTLLYDLIYNPSKTLFLRKGVKAGARVRNGQGMLMEQADASWRIWEGTPIS